jgi:mercuric ion transport protein
MYGMTGEDPNKPKAHRKSGWIAGGGALSGLGALIGASCCVLPLILINLGVSAALVGKLAFVARFQHYFMGGAVILLAAAIVAAFWKGRRPGKRVVITLALAAALIVAAYVMPFYEPQLLRWVNQ